ncbi:MAG: serine hydrolase domain-containing protein [Terracidiphilus sp.]|jgi:CubicO group peptidase (beta-lactamase class C family)
MSITSPARFASCIALLAALSPLALAAQSGNAIDPGLKDKIDRIATQVLEDTGVPSASIAVVQHGKLAYTHAYGKARLASESAPAVAAAPQMRYSIGSISKQFTAAAVLLLQEEGKLSLDDAVEKYIPGLTRGNEVTIRQILSHTSGYQDYWPEDYLITPMQRPVTTQRILDLFAKKPLNFEPGTQWQYSNTNFVIAGRIVEQITGKPLMDFLTSRIFRPLGMASVWDSDQAQLTQADAAGYYRHALGPLRVAPQEGKGWLFGAAELAMTAHDLALWDESLIAQTVLKPESYKEMFTEVKLKNGKGTQYGLGVGVRELNGHRAIVHSGEISGFVSDNEAYPDDGIAVAVLTNEDAVGAATTIANLIAPAVLGVSSATDAERQALAIFRGLQQGRIDRTLFAPNLNDYFTAQTQADYQSSLVPLGEPLTFRQTNEELRAGMTFRSFDIAYPRKKLHLTTYTYPNGKLEQYLITAAQ